MLEGGGGAGTDVGPQTIRVLVKLLAAELSRLGTCISTSSISWYPSLSA